MRSFDEHLALCLGSVGPLAVVELSLLDALDCILADDVTSTVDLPGFDNSSMDGYAVVVADVESASVANPVRLTVVGDLAAGATTTRPLQPATAVRIMTGAPVPPGTGAIVPVEATDGGVEWVQVSAAAPAGQHIRPAGDDVRVGQALLRVGQRLGPRHLGLLAAAGIDRVRVRPRPRVVVVSTGSELVDAGRRVGFGQVSDSNGYALTAAVLEAGAIAYRAGIVADDAKALTTALEDQLVRADVIITSGGVSAGAYDTVKEVLSTLGTVDFERVAMQPGKPQGFGTIGDGVPIFTLPGNPVSSYVSFEAFVRPCLRKMMGETQLQRDLVPARAGTHWSSPVGKRQFVRVVLRRGDDGTIVVPVGGHGSHLVADLAAANALAVVPEGVTEVLTGDILRCMLLDRHRR